MRAAPKQQLAPPHAAGGFEAQQPQSAFASQISVLSEADEIEEYGSYDREGLLAFLDTLAEENIRVTSVTYCVNYWKMYGVIPLKHHGFVLSCGRLGFLSLDFTTKGILWDVDEEFPELADNTFHAKSYTIDVDPMSLKQYCQNTEPFHWYSNDCATWADGLLKVLGVRDSAGLQRHETVTNLLELEAILDKVKADNGDDPTDNDVCKTRPKRMTNFEYITCAVFG